MTPRALNPSCRLRRQRAEKARWLGEEERRRAELVKGGTATGFTFATSGPAPLKAHPTAIAAWARGGGRGRAGEGMLSNKPGEEGVAGEGVLALRGQDGV